MDNLLHRSFEEYKELFQSWDESRFRAEQLKSWIWKKGVLDFESMSNLSQKLRERLKENFVIIPPKIVQTERSTDGTIKYLLELEDGKTVETVWIPREDQKRVTVCVSSQVGCKIGCKFCLTAQQKVERDLTPGEIAGQLLVLPESERITNVVLMGMGEPFDNYDNVIAALEWMTDPMALNLGPGRITVSTSGLIPRIEDFVRDTKCQLAISLNAPNNFLRDQIMPINRAYNVEKLLDCCRRICQDEYPRQRKKRFSITFEYILIKDFNDQPEHALELCKRLRGLPCKVNLLLYNETPNTPFKRPEEESVEKFRKVLGTGGYLNFVRTSRGRDISAACGQLASAHKRNSESLSSGAENTL